jgi:hypothetical protein
MRWPWANTITITRLVCSVLLYSYARVHTTLGRAAAGQEREKGNIQGVPLGL